MDNNSFFIMGLPSAGKTSFLAALSFSLQQRTTKTKLQWRNFTGNHQYLTKLAENWLIAEPVERTASVNQQMDITIELFDDDENKVSLNFPDLSGEMFQAMYRDREMDIELADRISSCDGILLFINPLEIKESILISSLPSTARSAENEEAEYTDRNPVSDDPTDVLLVELMQFCRAISGQKEQKLMVIVSAWDTILSEYDTPELFIKSRVPLLWQYLYSTALNRVAYYGISAQGGMLDNEVESQELLEKHEDNPVERILVIDNSGATSHDITLPLWELLNKEV